MGSLVRKLFRVLFEPEEEHAKKIAMSLDFGTPVHFSGVLKFTEREWELVEEAIELLNESEIKVEFEIGRPEEILEEDPDSRL